MYKIFKILILLIIALFNFKAFFADASFLWEDLWLDLYKNIDEWYSTLQTKNYEYELKWQNPDWTAWEEINRILASENVKPCLTENLQTSDVEKINSWDIQTLEKNIKDECKKDWKIATSELNSLFSKVREVRTTAKSKANQKTKAIQRISRIWLYSDWTLENSPFDIVSDIKDIDYIIFTSEIPYKWEKPIKDKDVLDYLKWKFKNDKKPKTWSWSWDDDKNSSPPKNDNWNWWDNWNNNWNEQNNNWNWNDENPICIDPKLSWLNDSDIKDVLWIWKNFDIINWHINSNYNPDYFNDFNFSTSWSYNPANLIIKYNNSSYSEVADDNKWWCKSFFCITIEFIIKDQNLLWWWKTRSIESILEKSNWHFKKFSNTSLVQSKMTTNNFELWLRDLNLPDIFHMWVVIQEKPVPMLELKDWIQDKKWVDGDKEMSVKNLLRKWFESVWMNYERENDLEIFFKSEIESKTIEDSAWLTNAVIIDRLKRQEEYLQEETKLLDEFVWNFIKKESTKADTEWLYKEFVELEKFVWQMTKYANSFNWTIKKMNEIPIHK